MKTALQHYKSVTKPPKEFFKQCESQFIKYDWKFKGEVIKSTKNFKHRDIKQVGIRLIKSTRKYEQTSVFLYRTVVGDRIESQLWKYEQTFDGLEEVLTKYLLNLEIYEGGKHFKLSYDPWRKKVRFGLSNVKDHYSSMNNGYYTGFNFYPNDWFKSLGETELKYLPKNIFSQAMHPNQLEYVFRNRVILEYCFNIKAKAMYQLILEGSQNIDLRVVTLKWLKKYKHKIKNSNVTFSEIDLINRINERGKYVPGIESIIQSRHVKRIPKDVGIVKWQNWAIKNKISMDYYIDYLNMIEELKITDRSFGTLIPDDLTKSHNLAVDLINEFKDKASKELMEKANKKNRKLEYSNGFYSIIIPETEHDIVDEGKKMRHCVGSAHYLRAHKRGKTTILFIRHASNLKKSLYTLEYRDGRIIQCQGYLSATAPSEIWEFLDVWKENLNKKETNKSHGRQNYN